MALLQQSQAQGQNIEANPGQTFSSVAHQIIDDHRLQRCGDLPSPAGVSQLSITPELHTEEGRVATATGSEVGQRSLFHQHPWLKTSGYRAADSCGESSHGGARALSSCHKQHHTAGLIRQDLRVASRYERVSEAAWCGRLQQLAVFVAWAGISQRSCLLHSAVTPTNLCNVEFVLCAFSAWVLLTRRCRDAASAARSAALLTHRDSCFALGPSLNKRTSTATTAFPRCTTTLPENSGVARCIKPAHSAAPKQGGVLPRQPPVHTIVEFSKGSTATRVGRAVVTL